MRYMLWWYLTQTNRGGYLVARNRDDAERQLMTFTLDPLHTIVPVASCFHTDAQRRALALMNRPA